MAAAGKAYDEGLAIERTLDDPAGLAEALYNAGFVAAVANITPPRAPCMTRASRS